MTENGVSVIWYGAANRQTHRFLAKRWKDIFLPKSVTTSDWWNMPRNFTLRKKYKSIWRYYDENPRKGAILGVTERILLALEESTVLQDLWKRYQAQNLYGYSITEKIPVATSSGISIKSSLFWISVFHLRESTVFVSSPSLYSIVTSSPTL